MYLNNWWIYRFLSKECVKVKNKVSEPTKHNSLDKRPFLFEFTFFFICLLLHFSSFKLLHFLYLSMLLSISGKWTNLLPAAML